MFQLEYQRLLAKGTAAAMLGAGLLRRDVQNRRMGYSRLAGLEWEAQTESARTILSAYAAGINAAQETQPTPYEFLLLGNHKPDPWRPEDSLAVMKMVADVGHWEAKVNLGVLASRLGAEALNLLVPDLPAHAAVNVPAGAKWGQPDGSTHRMAQSEYEALARREPGDAPVGYQDSSNAGGGSNCWVIGPELSASGSPLVVGDPHLGLQVPGQWFVVHMECPEFIVAGPCNPCYPGPIFYGHNTKVAWTMTHALGDRFDVYREKVRRGEHADVPQVLFDGAWEPLVRREEHFRIAGQAAVERRVVWASRRHGVVVHGDPLVDKEVLSCRWGLDGETNPGGWAHDMDAMLALHKAETAEGAREALRAFDSISGNYCFADVHGRFGYQYAGSIPRRPGWVVPVPGWGGPGASYEWDGFVPKEELPMQRQPERGLIWSANNRHSGRDYPHYLSFLSTRFRADRLAEIFADRRSRAEKYTAEDMARVQADTVSVHAREFTTEFLRLLRQWQHRGVSSLQDVESAVVRLLEAWDFDMRGDSAAALCYHAVLGSLSQILLRPFFERVPELLLRPPRTRQGDILLEEMIRGSRVLLPAEHDSWGSACRAALAKAARELAQKYGTNPEAWRWDRAHSQAWHHSLGRTDKTLFDLTHAPSHMPVAGDGNTICCAHPGDGKGAGTHGVTYRQILDLSDLSKALICVFPGNSGQPKSAHYGDNLGRLRDGDYHPLLTDWSEIRKHTESELVLRSVSHSGEPMSKL